MGGGRVVLSKDGSNGVTNPLLIITLIILFLIEGMMLPYFSAESKIKYIYATILPCYIYAKYGTYGSISDRDGIIRIRFAKHDFEHLWCKFTWLYNNCF